jgi:hypothetical protein
MSMRDLMSSLILRERLLPKSPNWSVTPPSRWSPFYDRAHEMQIQIQNTYSLALSLATSATTISSTLRPRAYVRLTFPYYEMKASSPQGEGADLKPDGARGRWWHETLRGLGKLQETGLNLGVIRCAAAYGPGGWGGEVVARLVVGHVYSYL